MQIPELQRILKKYNQSAHIYVVDQNGNQDPVEATDIEFEEGQHEELKIKILTDFVRSK